MYWVVHNFLRVHLTIREVPAVALGILERRLSVPAMFQMHMAEVMISKGKNVPITLNQCRCAVAVDIALLPVPQPGGRVHTLEGFTI